MFLGKFTISKIRIFFRDDPSFFLNIVWSFKLYWNLTITLTFIQKFNFSTLRPIFSFFKCFEFKVHVFNYFNQKFYFFLENPDLIIMLKYNN